MMSHSKSHENYYSDSKSPHCACKVNSHFCTVMSKLASITLPQSAWGLGQFWGHLRYVKQYYFSCYLNVEKPQVRREIFKTSTQMVLLQRGGRSLLSVLSLKPENNLSDSCTQQHFVSFHCVQTFLLLKMLHLMEQLVLKATMFCFSLV